MPVEFLGIAATNDGSEITARSGASFDKDYTLRLARAHEEHGWDRVLFAYGSGSPDPDAAAASMASKTTRCSCCSPTARTCPTRPSRRRRSPPSTRSATAG